MGKYTKMIGCLMGSIGICGAAVLASANPIESTTMNPRWYAGGNTLNFSGGMQVFRASPSLIILRQSKDLHFEAPFLYLIFGSERAVLLDTGAIGSAEKCPLQTLVQSLLIDHYGEAKAKEIELLVLHTHAHSDHQAGDEQFLGRERTSLIPARDASRFYGIKTWPVEIGKVQLGDRELSVIPSPGHEGHDIAIYDPKTAILFSGDSLYPGRLYVRDWTLYRQSIERLASFVSDKPLRWILGAHIEMSTVPGVDFPAGATFQANERPLELTQSDLQDLVTILRKLGPSPTFYKHDSFLIVPIKN